MTHDVPQKKRRIVWCDNLRDKGYFDTFQALWNADTTGYWLDFIDLNLLTESDGAHGEYARQALKNDPPALFLLDWEEGATAPLWGELDGGNGLIPLALMSFNPVHTIVAHTQGLSQYPFLTTDRVLTRPFPPEALRALLPTQVPTPVASATPVAAFELPAAYGAWRWLNEDFQYLQEEPRTSPGWKLSYHRPPIKEFKDTDKKLLKGNSQKGESDGSSESVMVRQYTWSELPTEPGRFDRVMLQTRPLQAADPAPPGAVYVQQAVHAPVATPQHFESRIIQGVIRLMQDAGFDRGRYYHHSHVPGLNRAVLELLVVEPDDTSMLPPPAVAEMDSTETRLVERLLKKYQANAATKPARIGELIFEKLAVDTNDEGENDKNVWNQYVNTDSITEVLVVPVYFHDGEKTTRQELGYSEPNTLLRGLFLFDLGRAGLIEDRLIKIAQSLLLAALNTYNDHRAHARGEYERKRLGAMDKLHRSLGEATRLQEVAGQACQTALELMEVEERGAESGLNREHTTHERVDRSVLYVRYSATQQVLEHVATHSSLSDCNLQPLKSGDRYPLDCNRFFLVEAARTALEALKNAGQDADILPLLRPHVAGMPQDRQVCATDWNRVFGADEERIQRAVDWYKSKVKAVFVFPVVAQGVLQGVLVVRSNRAYEFTQRRVKAVKDVVRAMRAHLMRVGLLQRGKAWHSLLAHEIRSILGRLEQTLRADTAHHASAHASALLSLATTLAQGSLHATYDDQRRPEERPMATADLWRQVDDFGLCLCAQARIAHDSAVQWVCEVPASVEQSTSAEATAPDLLFRVLLMLIDNAFRYGSFNAGNQVCLKVSSAEGSFHLSLHSPGQWPCELLQYWATTIQSQHWLDEEQSRARPYLGLSLVHWLCTQARAQVLLENRQGSAIVCLIWPVAAATNYS